MRDGFVIKEGIACAPAIVFVNTPVHVEKTKITVPEVTSEVALYLEAREKTRVYLENEMAKTTSRDAREFMETSVMFLMDPYVEKKITDLIKSDLFSAESAIHHCYNSFVQELLDNHDPFIMHNEYEIRNLAEHIIITLKRKRPPIPVITGDCIFVANNLTPAQLLTVDNSHIKGVILEDGNTNSHMAIVLRSLNIPTIFNVENASHIIKNGMNVLMDAYANKIYLNPLEELIWSVKKHARERIDSGNSNIVNPLIAQYKTTRSGERIEVLANIGSLSEIQDLKKYPSSGIGLFRTEFLFMNHTQDPTEDEQFECYRKIVESLPDLFSITFRTFDFSADKLPLYLSKPVHYNCTTGTDEDNTILNDILTTQLRALMRASVFGHQMQIMFPMAAEYEDFVHLLDLYQQTRESLMREGTTPGHIKIGVMIETPAAAIMSESLASLVDFFSIGTNDLTHYTETCSREFATKHNNELSPAVVKLIALASENAQKAGIPVSICGEIVHEQKYLPLLYALGIRSFSVAPFYLSSMLYAIHTLDIRIPRDFREHIRNLRTRQDVIDLSANILKSPLPVNNQ